MSAVSKEILIASSWVYLAEGNHHVLFRYIGDNVELHHTVLRVAKVMGFKKHEYTATEEYLYHEHVVQVMLSEKYLLCMHPVEMSPEFIHELAVQSHARRPPHRRDKQLNTSIPTAFLMKDLTKLTHSLPIFLAGMTWTSSVAVEIKVKCGLYSTSPLAHPLKKQYSRYAFTQYVRLAQTSQGKPIPWGTFQGISAYDPHMLCSRNLDHIQAQLHQLFRNPQNNLKISINGEHVYGLTKTNQVAAENALRSVFPVSDATALLQTCVAKVLAKEDVCERLESMQRLDHIDVEGVALVYHRLLCLWDGDLDAVYMRIKEALLQPLDQVKLHLMSNFPSTAGMSRLQACSESECLLLICAWLMSLAACDASIVLTLHPLSNIEQTQRHIPQDRETSGVVQCSGVLCAYVIKCIDIGPKPVWKVKSHIDAEKELCSLAAEGIQLSQDGYG